jgi:hypothetical protein
MAFSYIDFIVASGVFLIFITILFNQVGNYVSNYKNIAETSELREVASILFNTFFTGKGLPSDWENQNSTPFKIGLINDLFLIVINVSETSGNQRNNITINGSIEFDPSCSKGVLNNTIRLYDSSNTQVPFQLYNQSFCESGSLRRSEVVFNLTLLPNESKFFFLYFSSEKEIVPPNYFLEFPNETNYTFQVFPVQEFHGISVGKLIQLRNLSYEEVIQTLPKGYNFRVEIS